MPRRFTRLGLESVVGLLLVVSVGCGSEVPAQISGSTEEATIKGKVLVNGKPVKGGELNFRVANANRPGAGSRTAKIGSDGSYSVTTLVGQNYVEVDSVKELQTPKLRRYLDDDTPLHVPSGGSDSLDISFPPVSQAQPTK